MPVWIGESGANETCAGAKIKAAMHMYSRDLYEGCEHFSKLAQAFTNVFDIRLANSSCIFFGVSCIEARLNEHISMASAIYGLDDPEKQKLWIDIERAHIRSSLPEKWDAVAENQGGTKWSNGIEPFQSFNLVATLRNELIHYKGALYGKDEAPNKRISHIMKKLGVTSTSNFTEDDCSSWVSDLLETRDLGSWILSSISPLWEQMFELLGRE